MDYNEQIILFYDLIEQRIEEKKCSPDDAYYWIQENLEIALQDYKDDNNE